MEEGCLGMWGGGGGGSMRSCLSAAVEEDMEGEFGSWEHPVPSGAGGSIAERRCGFNKSPWVNTNSARFRSVSPLASPAIRSPYLTIPPGLSPAALLDSPVMLPDSQALPSPTTGTIQLPSLGHEFFAPSLATVNGDKENCEDADSSFMFNPQINPVSNPCMQNSADQDQIQRGFVDQVGFPKPDLKGYTGNLPADSDNKTADRKSVADTRCHLISDQTHQLVEPLKGEDMPSQLLLEGDQTGEFSATGIVRPSEDGYNWRKYGQKQVKGSEFPRSYYKCTHPSCQVKKKVERSLDGQVTQIVYKGSHCHPKPLPTRRSAFGSPYPLNERYDSATDPGSYANIEGGSIWSSHPGSQDSNIDWRVDSLERTPSTSVITEHSDPPSTAQGKQSIMLTDNPELSSTLASQNDDEDGITQGSMSFEEDGDDETESKRRKKESCPIETNPASRAVREPRVVVQTVSEVDILEDGYRWRKYGQKIVKGNPNPRSYYKCTSPGCSVRKHVERASHDLKSVITTYEGKHNHEVPVARNSNHMNSGGSPQSASVPTSMVLPGSIRIPKCEPHDPDFVPCFDRKLELGGSYLKSGYAGSFTGDSKIGAPSCYEMKLPHLQPMTYSTFGMNPNNIEVHQAMPIMQDLPISFSIGLQKPNLAVAGYDLHHGRPIGPELQSFRGQEPKENGMRFLRLPKQEQENAVYDSHINTFSNAYGSLNGQIMGRHQSR